LHVRHSSITVTTGTYVEVIEAVQALCLGLDGRPVRKSWRRIVGPVVVKEVTVVVKRPKIRTLKPHFGWWS
jgi:hypothetical protein